MLSGESGIGKTALLEDAIDSAPDLRFISITGFESEIDLGFAAIHQLLAPDAALIGELAPPQRTALRVAFGLEVGPPPDRFLVGLGVLTLLARAAADQPLICIIDDAQWLDLESSHSLTFVARRLYADRIGLIFAVRTPSARAEEFEQLRTLSLRGLPEAAARQLLDSVVEGVLQDHVAERLISETEGNPLALLELTSEFTAGELASRTLALEPLPLSRRLEVHFLRQVRQLGPDAQAMLLLASVDSSGGPAELWTAAAHLGIDPDAAAFSCEASGLLDLSGAIRFRHPLIRSAVYHSVTDMERRRAHAALADAGDTVGDQDRRIWHRAAAVVGPDEGIASELERAADRARARGRYAAWAALLGRAAQLTPDDPHRAQRELAVAEAELTAGNPTTAREVIDQALPRLTDDHTRGLAQRLEGAILFATGRPSEAVPVLAEASRTLASDESLARHTMLEAYEAAIWAGPGETQEMARTVTSFPPPEGEPTVGDSLREGFGARFTVGYDAGVGSLRLAIAALRADDLDPAEGLRWFSLGIIAAGSLWDDRALLDLSVRFVTLARRLGALTALPMALTFRNGADFLAGRLDDVDARADEARDIAVATGNSGLMSDDLARRGRTNAFRGKVDEARAGGMVQIRESVAQGQRGSAGFGQYIVTLAEICAGRYDAALASAQITVDEDYAYITELTLPELVEAAVRVGQHNTAALACATLSDRALASGTDWALGLRGRCLALVSESKSQAEDAYREAIFHLKQSTAAVDLARTHLLFGEWLRRRKRRRDAREQLHVAYDLFSSMGAENFAARTAAELVASGEQVRRQSPKTSHDLTPQEARVAELAAEGLSNNQIATQLFLSPSTVDYHLRKLYRKLNVTSRTQLVRYLFEHASARPTTK